MIFQFGRYTVDVDVEKTRAYYTSNFSFTTSEVCSCERCQRFPNAIMSCSAAVVDFLNSLGIDPRKPGEVFGTTNERDNYDGWYHIVGTLLSGKISGPCVDRSNAFVPDKNVDFIVWFDDDSTRMGWIEENFPSPILELSFTALLSKQNNT